MRKRALRLRCPVCGLGAPFDGWLGMRERCEACGFKLEREPGYFLGSIYLNYGVTATAALGWIFAWFFSGEDRWWITILPASVFAVVFPLWFLRYARALWLAFDLAWDPPRDDELGG